MSDTRVLHDVTYDGNGVMHTIRGFIVGYFKCEVTNERIIKLETETEFVRIPLRYVESVEIVE